MIPSEVLDRLNPSAAAVSARWPVVIGIALTLLLAFGWGLIPRITHHEPDTASARLVTDELGRVHGRVDAMTHTFTNEALYPITLTGAGVRAEHFSVVGAALPKVVPAGGSVEVELLVEYTSCLEAAEETAPVILDVSAWWGSARVAASVEEDAAPVRWHEMFRESGC
ncbi:hypothetical protein [Nonomuraea endophytica]|uniref:3D (Asp-Asp-Asp) domain-containing protein n=1 Tax=Nonomuraea endophytica TaxID=714136 RepID=A0A7W8EE32_9ACTN|nr:hypothetical protein [Nonomuraea endophytica]MBB5074937.1 3D (Asp-Asp-Asp) domain-containing protein [Nonomuraea endophytica]